MPENFCTPENAVRLTTTNVIVVHLIMTAHPIVATPYYFNQRTLGKQAVMLYNSQLICFR